jgi:hypothetical protein
MIPFYILINILGVALIAIINLGPWFKKPDKSTLTLLGWILFGFGFLLQLSANYKIQSSNTHLKDDLILSFKEQKTLNLKYEHSNSKLEETTTKLQKVTDAFFNQVYSSRTNTVKKENTQIKIPDNGEDLTIEISATNRLTDWKKVVNGTVKDVNKKYYLVVHPIIGGDYYIQPDITVLSDGSWKGVAYFGRASNDFGKYFEVWLIANPIGKLSVGDVFTSMPEAELYSRKVIVQRNPK